jgi:predicted O-methyltransferase YrrM
MSVLEWDNDTESMGEQPETLVEIAKRLYPTRHPASKGDRLYEAYERFFRAFREQAVTMFEIGVFEGDSTKVFARHFPKGSIVGVDYALKPIDFADYPNVITRPGDQSDHEFLNKLADELAPAGIDIVLDDASHIGYLSLKTFEILFDRVKPGGLYIIEDWGAGYGMIGPTVAPIS